MTWGSWHVLALTLALSAGCGGGDDGDDTSDGDADSDADADGDVDGDSDADCEATTTSDDPRVQEYIEALQQRMAEWSIPGAAVAIFDRGEVHHVLLGRKELGACGPITADTRFLLGLVSRRAAQRDAIVGMSVGLGVMAFVVLAKPAHIAWPWYVVIGTAITVATGSLAALRRDRGPRRTNGTA